MNRRDQIKQLLLRALDSKLGVFLTVSGTEPGKRHAALSSLTSVKRELTPDIPEMLDLQIIQVPGEESRIAIKKIPKVDL